MKKINIALIALVIIVFAVPSVSSAAWWKPSTWFKANETTSIQIQQPSQDNTLIDLLNEKIATLEKENKDLKDQVASLNKQLSIKPKTTTQAPAFIPTPTIQNTPQVSQKDDSLLKVEKCKAQKDIAFRQMMNVLEEQLKEKSNTYRLQVQAQVQSQIPPGSVPYSSIASTTDRLVSQYHQENLKKAQNLTETYVNDKYNLCLSQ